MVDNAKMIDFVKDLRRAYDSVVKEVDSRFYTKYELVELALLKPANSFYMSEEDIGRIINCIEKGNVKGQKPLTMLKYSDLYEKYEEIKEMLPHLPRVMAIRMLSDAPAPRFYITTDWGRKVLNKYIRV